MVRRVAPEVKFHTLRQVASGRSASARGSHAETDNPPAFEVRV
jgi:hypothetical protein